MKIIWHSHSPRVKTGYGTPTALLLPRFRDLGHEVIASAFFGESEDISSFEGIPVYNTNDQKYGATVLGQLADGFQADLIITHMDAWALDPEAINAIRRKVAHWSIADTNPLGELDRMYYSRSASSRLCMSKFSARMLTEGGFPAQYVPTVLTRRFSIPTTWNGKSRARLLALRVRLSSGSTRPTLSVKAGPRCCRRSPGSRTAPRQSDAFR